MQEQDTPCKGCGGDCRDCDGKVVWKGIGRVPFYCCRGCKERAKSTEYRARITAAQIECTHPGCAKIRRAQTGGGLCAMHYRRKRLGQDLDALPQRVSLSEHRPCAVEGCERRYYAKGLCSLHYQRMVTTGDVGPVGLSQAAPGTRTEWQDLNSGYVYVYTTGDRQRGVLKQRVVMEDLIGRPLLRTETVHHINGVRNDNRTNGPLDENFRSGNLELWSKSHPAGQRVADKVAWAIETLRQYAPDRLSDNT